MACPEVAGDAIDRPRTCETVNSMGEFAQPKTSLAHANWRRMVSPIQATAEFTGRVRHKQWLSSGSLQSALELQFSRVPSRHRAKEEPNWSGGEL